MRPDGPLKLAGEVRDLQIVDADGVHCGIADDLEFEGEPGRPLRVRSILVGPGACERRLSGWLAALVRRIFGDSVVRVPWNEVKHITGRITLKRSGTVYGLLKTEERFAAFVKRIPFA